MFEDVQDGIDAGTTTLVNTRGNPDASVTHAGDEDPVGVELTFDMAEALVVANHILRECLLPSRDAHVTWFRSDADSSFKIRQNHSEQLVVRQRWGLLVASVADRHS